MLSVNVLAIFVVATLLWQFYIYWRSRQTPKGLKTLPGPKGYPLIGNVLEFPKDCPYRSYKVWADKYGPIFKMEAFGTTHVFLTRQSMGHELLSLRGAIYSDRPLQIMLYELITHNGNLAASPANKYWTNGRKFAQNVLSTTAVNTLTVLQAAEAPRLVISLLRDPDKYPDIFEQFTLIVTMQQVYGISVSPGAEVDYHIKAMAPIMETIERAGNPGAYMVDFLPVLKYLPKFLAPFKQEADRLHAHEYGYFKTLLAEARKRYDRGEIRDPKPFSDVYFDGKAKGTWDLTEYEVEYLLGTLLEGGFGTSSAAMQSWCLAMCHYPEWLARLQKELDEVVGVDRIPSFADMPRLPTVRAVMKETLRWRPVVPGGVPHKVTENDEYQGYFIPKGSIIHNTIFAMVRDEVEFPDPETFNPDRWLNPKYPTYREPLTEYPNLKRAMYFGFGRRICPGLESAQKALFIEIASIAWACNICKSKDEKGQDIPVPWYDYKDRDERAPKKFKFDIKPRDEHRVRLMEAALPR